MSGKINVGVVGLGISQDLIYRVRKGERVTHPKFILDTKKPSPDISLMAFSMSQRISY